MCQGGAAMVEKKAPEKSSSQTGVAVKSWCRRTGGIPAVMLHTKPSETAWTCKPSHHVLERWTDAFLPRRGRVQVGNREQSKWLKKPSGKNNNPDPRVSGESFPTCTKITGVQPFQHLEWSLPGLVSSFSV